MPRRFTPAVLATILAICCPPFAFAGPDIDESTASKPDAGGTPGTAKRAVGRNASGGTSLVSCSGALQAGVLSGDSVDMFVFRVWSTSEFFAKVDPGVGYPTSLWLFRVVEFPEQPGRAPEAYAVVGNDAGEPGANYSSVRFPGSASQYPPGTYAVAVTPRGVRPFGLSPTGGQGGDIQLFELPPNPDGTGLMRPTQVGGQLRLAVWGGDGSAAGPYALSMGGSGFVAGGTGAAACGSQYAGSCFQPHPAEIGPGCDDPACCSAVCAIDPSCCSGAWDQTCASVALQNCSSCGATPPECRADLDRNGVVNGDDLGLLLVDWGPCH